MKRLIALLLLATSAASSAQTALSQTRLSTSPPELKICVGSSQTATTTGTSKETLASCVIPAGALNGHAGFRIEAYFSGAVNANSKTAGVDIGAATIISLASSVSDQRWALEAICMVTAANTVVCRGSQTLLAGLGSAGNYYSVSATPTFSDAITIALFATTPTAAGDATLRAYSVYLVSK